MGAAREQCPLVGATLSEGCALPLTQPGSRESGEEIAHIPVVIVTTCLLESIHILEGKELLTRALSPVETANGASDIFRDRYIGCMEGVKCIYENTIDIEADGIEWLWESQIRLFPERRSVHKVKNLSSRLNILVYYAIVEYAM